MQRVFICDYIRTPIGRYGGALSGVRPDDLVAHTIRALMDRNPRLDWTRLDEVVLGCANQAGEDNRNVARMAALLAGLPETVPALTVNRLCASGMDAVISAARAIGCGEADLMLAGGVESMSCAPLVMPKPDAAFSRHAEIFDTTLGWRFVNPVLQAQYGIDSMPETAENVAEAYDVSRADQDAFALQSQTRVAATQTSGRLAKEIAPVALPQKRGDPIMVSADEHPRKTTLEKLATLPTPFRSRGTVTAGNASGINDGAAVLLLASEAALSEFDLTPLAEYSGGVCGGGPETLGWPMPEPKNLVPDLASTPRIWPTISWEIDHRQSRRPKATGFWPFRCQELVAVGPKRRHIEWPPKRFAR